MRPKLYDGLLPPPEKGRVARVRRDICPFGGVVPAADTGAMNSKSDCTVLIIDGNSDVSQLLAERLSRMPGIRVVGETSNVMLGAELAHQLEPHVILADFPRTGPPRVETYRWLARLSPASILLAHTGCLATGEGRELREAGVARCLLKGEGVRRLAKQIIEMASSANREFQANADKRE